MAKISFYLVFPMVLCPSSSPKVPFMLYLAQENGMGLLGLISVNRKRSLQNEVKCYRSLPQGQRRLRRMSRGYVLGQSDKSAALG